MNSVPMVALHCSTCYLTARSHQSGYAMEELMHGFSKTGAAIAVWIATCIVPQHEGWQLAIMLAVISSYNRPWIADSLLCLLTTKKSKFNVWCAYDICTAANTCWSTQQQTHLSCASRTGSAQLPGMGARHPDAQPKR